MIRHREFGIGAIKFLLFCIATAVPVWLFGDIFNIHNIHFLHSHWIICFVCAFALLQLAVYFVLKFIAMKIIEKRYLQKIAKDVLLVGVSFAVSFFLFFGSKDVARKAISYAFARDIFYSLAAWFALLQMLIYCSLKFAIWGIRKWQKKRHEKTAETSKAESPA